MSFEIVLKPIWQSCLSGLIRVYYKRDLTFIHTEGGGGTIQGGSSALHRQIFPKVQCEHLGLASMVANVRLCAPPQWVPQVHSAQLAQTKLAALHWWPHYPYAACPAPSKSAILRSFTWYLCSKTICKDSCFLRLWLSPPPTLSFLL
jgi:hypothetical protein